MPNSLLLEDDPGFSIQNYCFDLDNFDLDGSKIRGLVERDQLDALFIYDEYLDADCPSDLETSELDFESQERIREEMAYALNHTPIQI
ncbi:hypothetical protein N7451_007671 [Penicillium sp. IBT 35674x]|nr:hypothetical protein N7451_007671 [Penicillium sp. IBT 35674x]